MGVARLWREAPWWRQASVAASLGTLVLAIGPASCAQPSSPVTATAPPPPPGSGGYTSPATPSASTQGPSAPPVPPGPATGLTLVPSPSAPVPVVPPTIAPNRSLGSATIQVPQRTETPGFGTIRPTTPRTYPDTIPPREP